MLFTTYEPNAVINDVENLVIGMATTIEGTWQIKMQANDSLPMGTYKEVSPLTPTPPTPLFCFWVNEWSWQSPETYIPLIWAKYNDGECIHR